MTEHLRFYTLDELQALSIEELQALWELVPTDRQRAYRQSYEREVRNAGAQGSDQLEAQVTAELLRRYEDTALVPVGTRWARTPRRVQDAARKDEGLTQSDDDSLDESRQPSPLILIVGAVLLLILLGAVFLRGSSDDRVTIAEATPDTDLVVMPSPTLTPTPLALDAQDDIIREGDDERTTAYPVSLQVALSDGSPPRVWVVQRRAVRASEWNYDPNPDIASFINGMSVHSVMGIPYSEDNAAWFENITKGTVFTVIMNTGATLRFDFAARADVRRSETDVFRQVSPGLVLLLLGERDPVTGLPTTTRTLIMATYPPEQELGRGGALAGLPLPELAPLPATPMPDSPEPDWSQVDVQLLSVTTQPGQLTTRFRIYNSGNEPLYITGDDIQLALGYVPNPAGPYVPAENLAPLLLLSEQGVDISLYWVWREETFANLQVGAFRVSIQF